MRPHQALAKARQQLDRANGHRGAASVGRTTAASKRCNSLMQMHPGLGSSTRARRRRAVVATSSSDTKRFRALCGKSTIQRESQCMKVRLSFAAAWQSSWANLHSSWPRAWCFARAGGLDASAVNKLRSFKADAAWPATGPAEEAPQDEGVARGEDSLEVATQTARAARNVARPVAHRLPVLLDPDAVDAIAAPLPPASVPFTTARTLAAAMAAKAAQVPRCSPSVGPAGAASDTLPRDRESGSAREPEQVADPPGFGSASSQQAHGTASQALALGPPPQSAQSAPLQQAIGSAAALWPLPNATQVTPLHSMPPAWPQYTALTQNAAPASAGGPFGGQHIVMLGSAGPVTTPAAVPTSMAAVDAPVPGTHAFGLAAQVWPQRIADTASLRTDAQPGRLWPATSVEPVAYGRATSASADAGTGRQEQQASDAAQTYSAPQPSSKLAVLGHLPPDVAAAHGASMQPRGPSDARQGPPTQQEPSSAGFRPDARAQQAYEPPHRAPHGGGRGREMGRKPRAGGRICKFWTSRQGCKNGDSCAFVHEGEGHASDGARQLKRPRFGGRDG